MRIALIGFTLAAPLAFVAMPAQAQMMGSDPAAQSAIVRGDYAGAERLLNQQLRIYPDRPELLLNLAAVYSQTGRPMQARRLYRQVLVQDDVLMDLPGQQTAGSHLIATRGLGRLDRPQTAQR